MIFLPPSLEAEVEVIGLIDELRDRLRWRVHEPRLWVGNLRRLTLARSVQGSNSIEGYTATLDDVVAAMDGDETVDAGPDTQHALQGYRDAMTYILQLADDSDVLIDQSLIRSLHFMMVKHDLAKSPGRWRPGAVFVRRDGDGEIVYEAPDAEIVGELMGALVESLSGTDGPALVRAAMAHLNLVMIHPFRDGNGRMARALQTLVLTRDRILSPEFNSIEEYLGRNTQAYYDVLAAVGQGRWNPATDARPWLRFCLTAHYRQALTLLRRLEESERLWDQLSALVASRRLPPRMVGPMFDAALGLRLRNTSYRSIVASSEGEDINHQAAGRDLKQLVDAGLLEAVGQTRARRYRATEELLTEWSAITGARARRGEDDPFAIAAERGALRLF